MALLQNWRIGRRLTIVMSVILGLSLLSSVVCGIKLRELGQHVQEMVGSNLRLERAGADWYANIVGGVMRATAVARSSDDSLVGYFAPLSARSSEASTQLQKAVEAALSSPAARAQFDKVSALRTLYLEAREQINTLKKAGDAAGATRVFQERFEPNAQAYLAGVQELLQLQRGEFDAAAARIEQLRLHIIATLMATTLLALLVGTVLAYLLTRSITAPLADAEAAARSIAEMDLRGHLHSVHGVHGVHGAGGQDEAGQLLRSIDGMRQALRHAIGQVRGAVESISTASHEIAAGSQDLSNRTEQTASNLQETASAMEQLTGTVRSSADSAAQANQLVSSAAEVAQRGGAVVGQVVQTMDEINQSSKRIADIIGTIDGIAFQTNILALNAAVEAARAGEQGRGFAVVAGEVRSLAQRCAEAAKEIKGLIGHSVEKVETGSRLVQQAGSTMGEIVASVKRVSDIIGEISHAAREQNQGIGQINGAVTELDRMTQQNAALVEQSSAAASSLSDQATRLREVVGTFRLADA